MFGRSFILILVGILFSSSVFAIKAPSFTIRSDSTSTDTVSLYYKPTSDHTANPGKNVQGSDTSPGQTNLFPINIDTSKYTINGVNSSGQICGPNYYNLSSASLIYCVAVKNGKCRCIYKQ